MADRLETARQQKEVVKQWLDDHPECPIYGIGIGSKGVIVLMPLDEDPSKYPLEIDGVPVTYKRVSEPRLLDGAR